MNHDMIGKIVLVTGATFGIGKETARGLAAKGARVVLVGRDAKKAQAVAEELRATTGNAAVEFLLADLSSQAEVKRLAADVRAKFERLDVLVNNAGGIFTERGTTVDGFERTWALNHLAYFTLTVELLDLLRKTPGARVVNVSSAMHAYGKMAWDDLQGEAAYDPTRSYAQSKLANVLFTRALARRLEGTGVTANALHPGAVASGFGQDAKGLWKAMLAVVRPFFITPEKGARTSIWLASAKEVEGVSGGYFANSKPKKTSRTASDVAAQERLWALSKAQTGLAA
ncbi:MAG: SDR family oxidoreductase [Polyangiaceae bacterium]